jgi:serine/threonine protein kinase
MIGDIVSHYRILSLLGSGATGVVFEGEDVVLGRKVAIKFLWRGSEPSRESAQCLLREAQTLLLLKHPNICTVYELSEHRGRPFLVEELLVGSTLQQIIATRKLDAKSILNLAIQIADGLGAAHASGIVHRDIKPANLFLTQENRAKILDFGLAMPPPQLQPGPEPISTVDHDSDQLNSAKTIVGTLEYMSPEQLRGDAATASSDIFSLGLVLYELLNGRHPFKKKSQLQTASAILISPLEIDSIPIDVMTAGLNIILSKMLHKVVAARYADGHELLNALKDFNTRVSG